MSLPSPMCTSPQRHRCHHKLGRIASPGASPTRYSHEGRTDDSGTELDKQRLLQRHLLSRHAAPPPHRRQAAEGDAPPPLSPRRYQPDPAETALEQGRRRLRPLDPAEKALDLGCHHGPCRLALARAPSAINHAIESSAMPAPDATPCRCPHPRNLAVPALRPPAPWMKTGKQPSKASPPLSSRAAWICLQLAPAVARERRGKKGGGGRCSFCRLGRPSGERPKRCF
uniref:Uncharacterized protein n=1 Tax=Leersia perrieri TaxID=77586 RepID=A0A0D9W306_9ORYZ